jgi:uncharacterized protein (TIGR02217 family)
MVLPVFPALIGLTYPYLRSPEWDTDVQVSLVGKRTTLGRRSYPIYRYELKYNVLRSDLVTIEWQTLLAFYNVVGGRRDLFQFSDPGDTSVTTMSFGAGDGATTQFQLTRALTGSGVSWVDPVFAPTGTPSIFINGVLKSTPADYIINATGQVTFTVAPASGAALTWTGTYNWLCRFDDDSATFEQFLNLFWRLGKIKLSTEKL